MSRKTFAVCLVAIAGVVAGVLLMNVRWPSTETITETIVLPLAGTQFVRTANLVGGVHASAIVSAASPVTAAFVNSSRQYACIQYHLLQGTVECDIPGDAVQVWNLMLFDERTPVGAVGSGLVAGLGIRAPANRYLVRNDVTYTIRSR